MSEHKHGEPAKVEISVELHAWKNRDAVTFTEEQVKELIDSGSGTWWCRAKGEAKRFPKWDKQYLGYQAYRLKVDPDDGKYSNIVPCKALWSVDIDGALLTGNKKYPTVSTGIPRPRVGSLVLMSTIPMSDGLRDKLDSGISELKPVVWQQFGHKDGTRVLLKLTRSKAVNYQVCQDDVTGDIYPYVLSDVYVLVPKC